MSPTARIRSAGDFTTPGIAGGTASGSIGGAGWRGVAQAASNNTHANTIFGEMLKRSVRFADTDNQRLDIVFGQPLARGIQLFEIA